LEDVLWSEHVPEAVRPQIAQRHAWWQVVGDEIGGRSREKDLATMSDR
jgi:hypothetical protein